VHPLVLSPKAWTCMPRSALASLPVMFHEMVVFEDSSACSKVTVPLTLESPRRTATAQICQLQCATSQPYGFYVCGQGKRRRGSHQGVELTSVDWSTTASMARNRKRLAPIMVL
jgi:hypothetical protein